MTIWIGDINRVRKNGYGQFSLNNLHDLTVKTDGRYNLTNDLHWK